MRPYTSRMTPPFTMIGSSVAEVEESRHPDFPVGATIVLMAGWVERGIVNPDKMKKDSPGESLGGVMPAPDLPKGWVVSGKIKVRETVVDGFDKMPQALMGLFTGDN